MLAHHKNHPANVKICFFDLLGSRQDEGAMDSTKCNQNAYAGVYHHKMQCTSKKNNPANVKLCFSEVFGSNLEGGVVGSTKFLCRGVSLQNAVRIA